MFSQDICSNGLLLFVQKCEVKIIDHHGVYFQAEEGALWPYYGIFHPRQWYARYREKVVELDHCVCGEEPCKFCISLTLELNGNI